MTQILPSAYDLRPVRRPVCSTKDRQRVDDLNATGWAEGQPVRIGQPRSREVRIDEPSGDHEGSPHQPAPETGVTSPPSASMIATRVAA